MKAKVKVSNITKKDLAETEAIQLLKAKALFQSFPIATKVWIAMRGFPMDWVIKNWNEISKH